MPPPGIPPPPWAGISDGEGGGGGREGSGEGNTKAVGAGAIGAAVLACRSPRVVEAGPSPVIGVVHGGGGTAGETWTCGSGAVGGGGRTGTASGEADAGGECGTSTWTGGGGETGSGVPEEGDVVRFSFLAHTAPWDEEWPPFPLLCAAPQVQVQQAQPPPCATLPTSLFCK